ncbi:1-acyl-sn-glycerol-3-phosphate acyltransferase BAT2, chloroplastic [Humulus lupulus]|uniref:1-acyl-sn-glycerol-3-phosphate acyltransferase BAT2, chloroplastic n=1 Tax=Humulus lupulus TaxID=3486 RepID=UPI002B406D48|nr:1-acyl-sn-glycerol-3-phosphate acyltransferase BAT2, chloroplastic [Humulus lupulus]
MESGSSTYGTMSLLCGQGTFLPSKTLLRRMSFKLKSEPQLDLCHGLVSLQSSQVFTCKELYVGGSSHKRLTLSYSNFYAHNTYLCIPRKHDIVSRCYSDKQEKLNIPHYDVTMKNRDKIPRHVIMRSELTGTGIPEAASPLTDISLRSKVRGICFYAVTSVVAIFLFVLMLVEHPFVLLLDRYRRKAHYFIAKMWASLTVGPFFKITVEGLENLPLPDTPAVYVSNHQSFLDIYTLLTLGRAFKFISKTSIFLFPVIGWAMFLLGVIPLKRMDSKSQLDCLKSCMDLVKKGASVFFFPEGTRSKDGKLGAFKKGAFSIAAKTKVPVVPITLIGTGKVMPSGMEGILNSGSVKVIIHKPIEGSDPQVLCNESRNIIANGLLNHNA